MNLEVSDRKVEEIREKDENINSLDMNTLEQVIQEKDIYINFLETTISELEEKLIS